MELKALRVNLAKEYKGVWAGKVTWSESAARWMAERCMADSTCYDDGGRGIETFVEHELLTMCEDALTQECFDKDSISYNNLDLYRNASSLLFFLTMDATATNASLFPSPSLHIATPVDIH